ncbi:MAG: nucleotide exchange factor GrpE [Deltaproteobacteria bacterium]|jgi:molecular chaperone GrpE|nr:nucleotide exchange factor GrpE [Deltaproteobacteria bacterium]
MDETKKDAPGDGSGGEILHRPEDPAQDVPDLGEGPEKTLEISISPEGDVETVSEADWESDANPYKEKWLRAMADRENRSRRMEKELSDVRKYSCEIVLRDLVPVLENLHLALSYADSGDPAVKGLAEGVSMTIKDCMNKMGDHGFREAVVRPGDPFDPNFQEAVGQEPSSEFPDGRVTRVLSRGYLFHDRLLRPAKVMLAKNGQDSPPGDGTAPR